MFAVIIEISYEWKQRIAALNDSCQIWLSDLYCPTFSGGKKIQLIAELSPSSCTLLLFQVITSLQTSAHKQELVRI